MDPQITFQAVFVPVSRSRMAEEGFLAFADGHLLAVAIHLQYPIDPALRGLWYLEAGYGPCTDAPTHERTFRSPEEAQQWVQECVLRKSNREARSA